MTQSTSIVLGDHLAAFVDEQVRGGHFHTADDVVAAGLALLQEREARVAALNAALEAGEQSGDVADFDKTAFLAEMQKKHGI